jgi:hypothetical protein
MSQQGLQQKSYEIWTPLMASNHQLLYYANKVFRLHLYVSFWSEIRSL